ncbi:MAG: hypothetical protein L0Y71_06000 [Gemmataceae bacterium]|nr:hypothetical protein [Gemmataceae bacterium]
MNYQATMTPTADRARGRGFIWAGIGACVLAIGLVVAQYALQHFVVPWYLPALTTLGALMLLVAVGKRGSVTRFILLVLMVALAGFQWYFLIVLSRLPDYEGPARVAQRIPAFQTTRADGQSFSDADLADGTPTVLTFFRGRW